MGFKYIRDFYGMTERELENTVVRCGNVDCRSLYRLLYGTEPTESEVEKMSRAVSEAMKNFSPCHVDLITAEFGEEETTAAKFVAQSDTMFDKPGDSLEQKLQSALTMVRATYQRANF